MQVKIKKLHKDAKIPQYSLQGDAGLDLTAVSEMYDEYGNVHYGTGLAFEIPEGYVGFLFPRSSNAKKELILSNSVGVLDSNYRGEVSFKFKPSLHFPIKTYSNNYEIGDRIGQIIILPYPKIDFLEVEELVGTNRGEGSYGSTGK